MEELIKSSKIERKFIEIAEEKRKRLRLSKGEFAALIWPYDSKTVCASRWVSIRLKAFNTGKPQIISLADTLRIARALGEDVRTLLQEAICRSSS